MFGCSVNNVECYSTGEWDKLIAPYMRSYASLQEYEKFMDNYNLQMFKDDAGTFFTNAAGMAKAAEQVMIALKAIPPNTDIPKDAWSNFIAGRGVADPALHDLFEAWQHYAPRIYTCPSWGPVRCRANVDIDHPLEAYSLSGSPSVIRSELEVVISSTKERFESYLKAWKQHGLKGDPPGYSPETERTLDAIANVDAATDPTAHAHDGNPIQ